jgi:hypothetical protein
LISNYKILVNKRVFPQEIHDISFKNGMCVMYREMKLTSKDIEAQLARMKYTGGNKKKRY